MNLVIFINLIFFICYFTKKHMMETFKRHWVACWVSWDEGRIETPYSTGASKRPLTIVYFHSLLLPLLFFGLCLLLVLVSPDGIYYPVCSGLTYEIYSGDDPSMYIYWMVCYHVIAVPYLKSVVVSLHTSYTLDDNSEPQSSLYSLKCFWAILCT